MTDTRTVWLVIASITLVAISALICATVLVFAGKATIEQAAVVFAITVSASGALAGILANTRGQGPAT